jgi:hypothetical protein
MVFQKYFQVSEQGRWRLESDIPWERTDEEMALQQPDVLSLLRDAALIESYAPMFALKSLEIWWNSVEESAVASIQFYEEYKHYFALQRYLARVGIVIPEREIIEVRSRNFGTHYPDRVRQLANYMISEHFTAHFYQRLLDQAREPVMKTLLGFLVKDEHRHCQVFYSLLEQRIEGNVQIIDTILDEAIHFRHQASEVMGEQVPVSVRNDLPAMLAFWKKLERLTGTDLRDYRRAQLATLQERTAP